MTVNVSIFVENEWIMYKDLEHEHIPLMNICILLYVPIFCVRQAETQKDIHSYQG